MIPISEKVLEKSWYRRDKKTSSETHVSHGYSSKIMIKIFSVDIYWTFTMYSTSFDPHKNPMM